MTAARLLDDLKEHELSLRLDGDRLLLSPAGRVTDQLRELIRTHKAELIALLTEPRRLWLVVRPGGTTTSHSLTLPATLAEMQGWYPGAEIHPEPEQEPHSERNAA